MSMIISDIGPGGKIIPVLGMDTDFILCRNWMLDMTPDCWEFAQ